MEWRWAGHIGLAVKAPSCGGGNVAGVDAGGTCDAFFEALPLLSCGLCRASP